MHPADIPKTAISTPFGLFEFTRITFGMRNAGNSFQRLIDRTLAGRLDNASPYLDDILIFSETEEDHRRHLWETFGLTANTEKCEFRKPTIEFLGHTALADGIAPCPAGWPPLPPTPAPRPSRTCRTS
jgi:Reverse transcriptase (RNA-dependent DNA polymerase)